jgi:hypothetical protein
MDERLSWDKHIDSICSKVGTGIGAMRRVKPFVPLSTTKMLYNAIVQPYFIHKILNDHTAPNLKEVFQFNNERHNTISEIEISTDLAPRMAIRDFGNRCFSYNGALHWNNLPHEAKIADSLSSFKSILKQRMS